MWIHIYINTYLQNNFLRLVISYNLCKIKFRQRNLAEITELIFAANLIHRGILNAEDMQNDQRRNLTLGNKMSVLGGDYLLANASMALAKLKNPKVVNDIAQAIADMTESEFVNEPKSVNEWAKKVYLGTYCKF